MTDEEQVELLMMDPVVARHLYHDHRGSASDAARCRVCAPTFRSDSSHTDAFAAAHCAEGRRFLEAGWVRRSDGMGWAWR